VATAGAAGPEVLAYEAAEEAAAEEPTRLEPPPPPTPPPGRLDGPERATARLSFDGLELGGLAPGTREKYAVSAQKLGQLQPFTAAFPPECVGQLASFGPT
jgi:hypothetical protein